MLLWHAAAGSDTYEYQHTSAIRYIGCDSSASVMMGLTQDSVQNSASSQAASWSQQRSSFNCPQVIAYRLAYLVDIGNGSSIATSIVFTCASLCMWYAYIVAEHLRRLGCFLLTALYNSYHRWQIKKYMLLEFESSHGVGDLFVDRMLKLWNLWLLPQCSYGVTYFPRV